MPFRTSSPLVFFGTLLLSFLLFGVHCVQPEWRNASELCKDAASKTGQPFEVRDTFETLPRIYDCFLFHDEADMLEIRLNELHNIVDYFVVLESAYTFTGLPSRLVFSDVAERFTHFSSQIIHVVVDDLPTEGDAWAKEEILRNTLLSSGLYQPGKEVQAGDIIIVADVDEIIKPSVLKSLKYCKGYDGKHIRFQPKFFYYAFCFSVQETWQHPDATIFVNKELLMDATSLRRSGDPSLVVPDAGWHCSYCFATLEAFRGKLHAFSHQEYGGNPSFHVRSHLVGSIRNGLDLFNRNDLKMVYTEPEDIPEYVGSNPDRFAYMLDRRGRTAGFKDYLE
ncbi:hypothetical protein ABBQ32_008742 [Trebouxia sp. C0010 RCD-2024]